FAFLVFIDCFTKWVSISYLHLKDSGIENPTILESIKGIKKARAAKKIKSEVMKHRFLGKIGVYLICALSAAVVDVVMRVLDKPTWAVMTVIGYLVVTELLSIIENLNDAGVEAMSGLIVFVKKKL
uniref:phage holin family protein n=2 Tax=Phascolarctobacterium TaxID=33024 RepID=UPI003FEDF962